MLEHWDSDLQRSCKVSILGITQTPAEQDTEQAALADPGLTVGLHWVISRGTFLPQPFCDTQCANRNNSPLKSQITIFRIRLCTTSAYCRASISHIQLQTLFSMGFSDVASIKHTKILEYNLYRTGRTLLCTVSLPNCPGFGWD